MPAFRTILSLALPVLLATTHVNAKGCYKGGIRFDNIHGGKQDTTQEVLADIDRFCKKNDGKTLETGKPGITDCASFKVTQSDNADCYEKCTDMCSNFSGDSLSGNFDAGLCLTTCNPNCAKAPSGSRRINYDIKLDGPTKKFTADICKKGLQTEVHGCASGSEQSHDGFLFKIDPNNGGC